MSGRVRTNRRLCLTAGLCVLIASVVSAAAGAQPTIVPALPAATLQAAAREPLPSGVVPLEGVVDAEAYVVGPGDVFAFSIGGRLPMEQRATVTADGLIILPEIGSFVAGGRSLAEVRRELRAALRRRYVNVDTDAALAQPRRFMVHVTGSVASPGRHAVAPMARVEDALAEAMGGPPMSVLQELLDDRIALLPALRNVQIRRQDGTRTSLDVLRYYTTGELEYNPFLLDGDIVHVPSFHRQGDAVFVEDRFGTPRLYDLRPSDTAADLVTVARGANAASVLDAVRLIRLQPDGSLTSEEFSGSGLEDALRAMTLRPLDRLLLVDVNERAGRMDVEGAVRFPGSYPILEGETTLQDVLEQAGGLLPNALPYAAYLLRPGPFVTTQPFDAAMRLAGLEDQAYEAGRLADLTFESRQYLSRELSGVDRVSVDLDEIVAGRGPAITLRDRDRLVVPEDPGGVLVLGQVLRPGLVAHTAGASAEHYIAGAGGLGPAATDIFLREAGSGALRPAQGAQIRPGDVLFVDRQTAAFSEGQQSLLLQRQQFEAQARRDRSEVRNRLITTTLGVIGTLLSAVALYTTLERTN
jgi:protein involved in polysaccharide export with SLBB domain